MCARAENQNKISAKPMTSVELLKHIKIYYIKIIDIS